jgi:hypothetical protein
MFLVSCRKTWSKCSPFVTSLDRYNDTRSGHLVYPEEQNRPKTISDMNLVLHQALNPGSRKHTQMILKKLR